MRQLRELTLGLRGAGTPEEFLKMLRSGEVDYVDIRFVDLPGRWHHVTLPASRVETELFAYGVGFDGSSAGFKRVESGDMVLIPDRSTAIAEDEGAYLVVTMVAHAAEADTRQAFTLDPRVIAGRAEDALRDSGAGDVSIWSPELEFYVFDAASYGDSPSGAYYDIMSLEAGWCGPDDEECMLGYRIQPGEGYHATPPCDRNYDLRNEIVARMEAAGIAVKYHHHENGAAGQVEIEILGEPLVEAADHVMLAKHIVRNTAYQWGLSATFMPKPLPHECGNGLHFHLKIMRGQHPVFYQEGGYAGLSREALRFIGGILSHGRALTALTNPSTNSYRRLRPGFEAPTNLFFSAANRSAAIRIPEYATLPASKTIEYRPSDATCNPYLAMAAVLAAGLDGLERGIDPGQHGFGPIDKNVHALPPGERDSITPIPASLPEALQALREDASFLSDPGIFPTDFVGRWIALKTSEAERVATRPHPAEFEFSFDC